MFWSRKSVSDGMRLWIDDCFEWFDESFQPPASPILPTKDFFSAPMGESASSAKCVLEDVKKHLNYEGDVEIFPLDILPAEYRHTYQSFSAVAGTHEKIDDTSIIRYDPELLYRPIQFINLIAHELMHARLAGLEDEVPGGAEVHELATDLGCIIAGFGIFQLQAADDAGWFGYMTQESRAHALAVFLKRRNLESDKVTQYFSTRCRKLVLKAIREL